MERIPEPELMNTPEQAKAYADADFSEPHDAFVEHFRKRFPEFSKGKVLDLGCGAADVVIRFARAYPEIKITGVDGSGEMLDIGQRDILLNGLENQIILKKCLLPNIELNDKKYDAVISNSLLHHLPDPSTLWNTVKNCAMNSAPIFIMDLMRPVSIESAKMFVKKYASDATPLLQEDFYNSLLAAYTPEEVREQLMSACLGHLSVESVSNRHLIVWGRHNE